MIDPDEYNKVWLEADERAKVEAKEVNQTKEWTDERRQEHIKRMLE